MKLAISLVHQSLKIKNGLITKRLPFSIWLEETKIQQSGHMINTSTDRRLGNA